MSSEQHIHKQSEQQWLKEPDPPTNVPCMISINPHEFIIVPYGKLVNDDYLGVLNTSIHDPSADVGIHVFNVHTNQWTLCYRYPSDFDSCSHKAAFNASSNTLYLYQSTTEHAVLHTLNLNSHALQTRKMTQARKSRHQCIVYANETDGIHIIGGDDPVHYMLNKQTSELDEVHKFHNYSHRIYRSFCLYVASKQLIVMIGGYNFFPNDFIGIWIYSIVDHKWTRLPVQLFYYDMSAVLSKDERYIIIAGGKKVDNASQSAEAYTYRSPLPSDCIYVLDISGKDIASSFTLKQSKICAPHKGQCQMAITGGSKDMLLAFGFVRRLLSSVEMMHLRIPSEIIHVIGQMYQSEILHWVTKPDGHYSIPLSHILTSST